jgi:RNA polymerase sigma-70 factor (ECF subfamily)
MEDQEIIKLYWERNEDAIRETEHHYGRYCHAIALRILLIQEDAAECVNDTWLRAWQAIPPEKPNRFAIWLGRITRNLSLNRLEAAQAGKRGGGAVLLSFEELAEAIGTKQNNHAKMTIVGKTDSVDDIIDTIETKELAAEISTYLKTIPKHKRIAFVGRYYYFAELDEIAEVTGLTKKHLSVMLHRIRQDLIRHLRGRGFYL